MSKVIGGVATESGVHLSFEKTPEEVEALAARMKRYFKIKRLHMIVADL